MRSIKKNRFQKSKRQTIKKRSNRNKKLKRRRTRKRNKIYGGTIPYGNTDLHLAVIKGDIQQVQNLISKEKDEEDKNLFLNHQNNYGNTALHLAVQNNNTEIVKSLIDKGADINLQDKKDNTALHLAVQNNNKEIVESLIDNQVDINLQNNDGNTALHLAILNGFNKGEERRSIYNNTVQPILMSEKVNINQTDYEQNTPLHLAIIQYEKDIDNLKDNDYFYYNRIIKSILKLNKFQFKPNKDGNSPLHLLVDMLQERLSEMDEDVNVIEKNVKIYNLIKDFVEILRKKYKKPGELFNIFSMKNEGTKTAYDILKLSRNLPNWQSFREFKNYKKLININPDVMTPRRAITKVVGQQEKTPQPYDPLTIRNQLYPPRSKKQTPKQKQSFRPTQIS